MSQTEITKKWALTGLLKKLERKEKDKCACLLESCSKWIEKNPVVSEKSSRGLSESEILFSLVRRIFSGLKSEFIDFNEVVRMIREHEFDFNKNYGWLNLEAQVEMITDVTEKYIAEHKVCSLTEIRKSALEVQKRYDEKWREYIK